MHKLRMTLFIYLFISKECRIKATGSCRNLIYCLRETFGPRYRPLKWINWVYSVIQITKPSNKNPDSITER